jgi:glyoxylate/hydroxypyruvate reductase A
VSAWARSSHTLEGVACFAGTDTLPAFLARPDMVVCLLPLTDATRGLCAAPFFAAMKGGSVFVNVGRGQHVVLPDLIASLDNGHLRAAVLDVFDTEPLPPGDPLWSDARIIVTPHMASAASDSSIASQIVHNVVLAQQGHALQNTALSERQY